MRDPSFSLKDFIKWVEKTPDQSITLIGENGLTLGEQVLIRLSEKNIVSKLKELNENYTTSELKDIGKAFRENGGVLKEIKGSNAKIKVSGCNKDVYVQRLFLRRPKK